MTRLERLIEGASGLSAENLVRVLARRRDRLVARQREVFNATRQREIDALGDAYRVLRKFAEARHV